MIISNLKKIWISALIFTVGAGLVLYQANELRRKSLRGISIFASAEKIDSVKKIEIIKNQQKITLYEDDNLWRVAEADNYFVDANLLASMQEAIILGKVGNELTDITDVPDQWTTLNLLDHQNNLLDSVQINEAQKVGKHYIRYPETSKIYLSNWKQMLPDGIYAWTNKTLFTFNGLDISRIEKNGTVISRRNQGAMFIDAQTNSLYRQFEHMKIFDTMSNIWYDKVLSAQEFDEEKYHYLQHIQFNTFDGLVTDVDIRTDYQEYWIQIKLSTDKLPKFTVLDYIEQNNFLYTDWWFRIPSDAGRILFMTKL